MYNLTFKYTSKYLIWVYAKCTAYFAPVPNFALGGFSGVSAAIYSVNVVYGEVKYLY